MTAPARYDKARAIALDHDIMRFFQGLGVAERNQLHTASFAPNADAARNTGVAAGILHVAECDGVLVRWSKLAKEVGVVAD